MKYTVHASMVVGVFVVVEADSKEAALDVARETMPRTLCHACAGSDHGRATDQWCLSDGLNGEPIMDKESLTLGPAEVVEDDE